MWLRQSTASQEILLGRFVDSTDGNTEKTALTIANTDIKLWAEGATALASKNSGGATHIANGLYYCVLDATDTATLGKLEVHVHVTGALAVKREFMVLPANVYDALVLGTDALQVDAIQLNGTAQTARDIGASVLISSGTGAGQLSVTAGIVAANVTQFGGTNGTFSGGRPEVNTSHWGGTAVASASVRANLTQILGTAPTEGAAGRLAGAFTTLFDVASPVLTAASVNQTGDSYARIGATGSGLTSLAPASTALSTAQWTNTRAGNLDNLDTTVSSRLAPTTAGRTLDVTATGAAGIDWGNVENSTTAVSLTGTTISVSQQIASVSGDVLGNVGGVLAPVPASIVSIAGGDGAYADSLLAILASDGTGWAVPIATLVWDATLASHLTAGTTGAALNGASAPTAATVAAAVWDLSTTGHTTSGTFGAAMNAAGSAGDPWATVLPGAYGAGTAGYIVGNNLDIAVSLVNTNVDTVNGTLNTTTQPSLDAITAVIGTPVDLNGSGATIAGNVTDTWNMLTDRIGTPATSLAADIAGVLTVAGNAQTAAEAAYNGTQTINTKIGTPQFGSVSTDLLANYTNINVIVGRLTATRAGYLDNLSGGAVALASGVNVTEWAGSAVAAPLVAGVPVVDIGYVAGIDTTAGQLASMTQAYVDQTFLVGAVGTDAITAASLAPDAGTELATAVWANATRTLTAFAFTVDTNVNATETAIKAKTDLIPASPAAVGSAMTLAAGSITEASIATPVETAGRPAGILGMIRRIFEAGPWGNKQVRDRSTGAVKLRNAADTADLVTSTQSTTGTTDTQTAGA